VFANDAYDYSSSLGNLDHKRIITTALVGNRYLFLSWYIAKIYL